MRNFYNYLEAIVMIFFICFAVSLQLIYLVTFKKEKAIEKLKGLRRLFGNEETQ